MQSSRGGGGIIDLGVSVPSLTLAGSYAAMRARADSRYHDPQDRERDRDRDRDMDMDMGYEPPSNRHRIDPEPRIRDRDDRHRLTPVTSGYGEPAYPAYPLASGAGNYSAAQMPRSQGGYSPQGGRVTTSYPSTTYDSRTTTAPVSSLPPTQMYKDPKTGQLIPIDPSYGSGFAPEPSRGSGGRHR
jgi:hypothetical protein